MATFGACSAAVEPARASTSIDPVSTVEKIDVGVAAPAGAAAEELAPLSDRLTVIRPPSRIPKLDFQELWHYRELAWALLQPFVTMVVLTLVFGKFAKFPSQDLPYPIFLFSAQLPWTYFSSAF